MTTLQEEKNKKILNIFSRCKEPKEVYLKIINLASTLKPFDPVNKTEENRVYGCQSLMYLYAQKTTTGSLEFFATSDALISKGLAALMLQIYNYENSKDIFTIKPNMLEKIQLFESLSPSRINGLKAFYLKLMSIAKKHH